MKQVGRPLILSGLLTMAVSVVVSAGGRAPNRPHNAQPVAVEETSSRDESRPDVNVDELPSISDSGRSLSAEPEQPLKVQRVWIWQETGDCLWNMAKENYGNPYLWPRIYEANRTLIKNPNVIFPKQQIVIPPLDGEPVSISEPALPFDPEPAPMEILPGFEPEQPKPAPPAKKKNRSNRGTS